mgnify:CR=1 FL=1|jgi:hypothetical protein
MIATLAERRKIVMGMIRKAHPTIKGVKLTWIEKPRLMRFQPNGDMKVYALIEVSAPGWNPKRFLMSCDLWGHHSIRETGIIALGESA